MADKKRVLIVDDEESMRLLLDRVMESIPGVEVTLAAGCDEALQFTGKHDYDLILLDLLMPGIGGIAVLNAIRAGAKNAATPVIIVSVMSDPATRIVCKSLGADDYVVKPIEREAVIAAVTAQLEGRSRARTGGD
jgi:DNA-binding response OmpR family regulator